jgi:hypothetical protein
MRPSNGMGGRLLNFCNLYHLFRQFFNDILNYFRHEKVGTVVALGNLTHDRGPTHQSRVACLFPTEKLSSNFRLKPTKWSFCTAGAFLF